jgi:hypothetical protein
MSHIKEYFGCCVHDWNIISKDIGDSEIEHLKKLGY